MKTPKPKINRSLTNIACVTKTWSSLFLFAVDVHYYPKTNRNISMSHTTAMDDMFLYYNEKSWVDPTFICGLKWLTLTQQIHYLLSFESHLLNTTVPSSFLSLFLSLFLKWKYKMGFEPSTINRAWKSECIKRHTRVLLVWILFLL